MVSFSSTVQPKCLHPSLVVFAPLVLPRRSHLAPSCPRPPLQLTLTTHGCRPTLVHPATRPARLHSPRPRFPDPLCALCPLQRLSSHWRCRWLRRLLESRYQEGRLRVEGPCGPHSRPRPMGSRPHPHVRCSRYPPLHTPRMRPVLVPHSSLPNILILKKFI